MTNKLVALTTAEANRLRGIARHEIEPDCVDLSPNCKRASTEELIRLGYIDVRGRQVASSGRVIKAGECVLTPLGREWLSRNGATGR